MTNLLDKQLKEALSRAKNVGIVEEAFTVEGCSLVIRNLRPDEYAAALKEVDGLEPMDYFVRFQMAQVSRAIVEVNGVDLRDVRHVTVDDMDPKTGKPRQLKRELHQYLSDHVLASWGREVLYSVARKLIEVMDTAERKAKEGITFTVPDENTEELYRRLMSEAQSVQSNLPDSLVEQVLSEYGLLRKTGVEELEQAAEKVANLAATETEPETESADEHGEQPRVPSVHVVDPHETLQRAFEAPEDDAPVVQKRQPVDLVAAATITDQQPRSGINPRFRQPQKS